MFGNQIDVYMDSIGQVIPEYLVNFEFFKQTMEHNGFVLVNPQNVKKQYSTVFRMMESERGSFATVIENIPQLKKTEVFQKNYSMLVKY